MMAIFLLSPLAAPAYAAPEVWNGSVIEGCDPSHHPNFMIVLPNNINLMIHTGWATAQAQKTPTSYKSQGQFDLGGLYTTLCADDDTCAPAKGVVLIEHMTGDTIAGSFNVATGKKVKSASFVAVLTPNAKPTYCKGS